MTRRIDMKLFLIKALIVTAVGLTMYMGVIMVEEDASKNRNEIVTLNRKINSLEDTLADVEKELTHVKILYKALTGGLPIQGDADVD
jgi:cell division protein FtsL